MVEPDPDSSRIDATKMDHPFRPRSGRGASVHAGPAPSRIGFLRSPRTPWLSHVPGAIPNDISLRLPVMRIRESRRMVRGRAEDRVPRMWKDLGGPGAHGNHRRAGPAVGLDGEFRCPACGRKFATKAGLAGKKIHCPRCGAGVRVPGGDEDTSGQPSRPASLTGVDALRRDRPAPAVPRLESAASPGREDDDEPGDSSPLIEDRPRSGGQTISARRDIPALAIPDDGAPPTEGRGGAVATPDKADKPRRRKRRGRRRSRDTST